MEGTEELWDEYWTAIEQAKFSIIAAQLLEEETEKIDDISILRDYQRRHKKHIRASYRHLRTAKRFRRKILRIEKKASKHG